MKTTSFILFTLFGLKSFAQTTTTNTNVNFGFNISETQSTTTGGGMGVGISVTETQSVVQPTQVIVVHETTPAPAAIPSCAVMDSEMGGITQSIKSKSFDDSQMSQARNIIKSKCMTSNQIKQILQVFSFEDSKLEIAKFAYQYVADKNNYYVVNDVFDFSSSSDELNDYIGN